MEAKTKHLEMIQSIILRMASNSFLAKGWAVTLVSALFALAAKDSNVRFVYVAFLPVAAFWFLDAFFLRQERMYRNLYNSVRLKLPDQTDFDLDPTRFTSESTNILGVLTSQTLVIFHGAMFATICVVAAILKKGQ